MKNLKNEKGITLVALVVTIIILLILAAVSLSLVAGSDGILTKASNAVDKTTIAGAQEQADLLAAEIVADYYDAKYSGNASYNITGCNNAGAYVEQELRAGRSVGAYTVIYDDDDSGVVEVKKGSTVVTASQGGITENGAIEWTTGS